MKAKEKEFPNKLNSLVWAALKRGDTNALGEIYNIYIDVLIYYGLKICNDKDKVMDGIHDLFVDLYKYQTKLSDTNNIEYYLKAALKHKLYKLQIVKETPLEADTLLTHSYAKGNYTESQEEKIIFSETEKERSIKLLKAFETLTKSQIKGLKLRYNQNLSYEEIAQILNISVASARTTIYRAIKSLRQHPFSLLILFQIIFY